MADYGKYETIEQLIAGEFPWVTNQTERKTFALNSRAPIPHSWAVYERPKQSVYDYSLAVPPPSKRLLPVIQVANQDFSKRYYFVADEKNNTLIELIPT